MAKFPRDEKRDWGEREGLEALFGDAPPSERDKKLGQRELRKALEPVRALAERLEYKKGELGLLQVIGQPSFLPALKELLSAVEHFTAELGVDQLRELRRQLHEKDTQIAESPTPAEGRTGVGEEESINLRGSLASPVAVELEKRHSVHECLAFLHEHTGKRSVDVARKIGIDRRNYTSYLSGRTIPSQETLRDILDFFAAELPELQEGAPARQRLFTLRSLGLNRLPENLTGPDYVEDVARVLVALQERRKATKF